MKPRDTTLRLKRFELAEKRRKVAALETTVQDFEQMAADLARQIAAEEERTGIRDAEHFAYSTFAKSAAQRREKLLNSIADLSHQLEIARREYEEAEAELRKIEPAAEPRDVEHGQRKNHRNSALVG
jgi:flagellar export protein FliJ